VFKKSGNPQVLELIKSTESRSRSLACLEPIKLEELNEKGKQKRLCAWCAEKEIFHHNQKYCSSDCSTSAMACFYPQKEDSLRFLLVAQDWKCAHCQYSYRPAIQEIMDREYEKYPGTPKTPFEDLPWWYLKRLKSKVPADKKPEVDHIKAISKGGDSIGLENHQILCFTCHKAKTKIDLSGKRIKNSV
jgi:HNH endonuclease